MEIKFIALFSVILIGLIANVYILIKNIYSYSSGQVLFRLLICVLHISAIVVMCIKGIPEEEKQEISKKETVIIIKVDSKSPSDTLQIDTLITTNLQILVNK